MSEVNKLTKAEHHARAMLMGLTYMASASVYANIKGGGAWLDADTMQPLDLEEVSERIQQTLNEDPTHDLGLPWDDDT